MISPGAIGYGGPNLVLILHDETHAHAAIRACASVKRRPVEDLHIDDLVIDDIKDQHPGPRWVEEDVAMSRTVRIVRWLRCVEALAEVIATCAPLDNLKCVNRARKIGLVLGDQCITQLAGQPRPPVDETVHRPIVH